MIEPFPICVQIELPNAEPLCPDAGHHPFGGEQCGPLFVKCTRRPDADADAAADADGQLEATMYRCPSGYSYWRVSRRCERTEKLLANNCAVAGRSLSRYAEHLDSFPVEWINLGRARQLRV